MKDCRVLVTGGAGFIGSHLVDELVERGARVTVVDDLSKGRLDNIAGVADRIDVHRKDLREEALVSLLTEIAPEVVFHLAGFASAPDSVQDVRADFEQNAVATLNLLEGVRAVVPDARVIFASSAAVYGVGSDEAIRETDRTVPLAPYGVSKLAAERYLDVYAKIFGLRTASLRLFPVYGPRLRRHVMWDLMVKLDANPEELMLEGDGTQVRDFLYVANAVEALLLVSESAPLEGEVYNASDGRAVSIREVAEALAAAMGYAPRIVTTGAVRPGSSRSWIADTTKLRGLGFEPAVSGDRGLREYVDWFRAQAAPTGPGSRR
jgi:UDP-glucose 4-epimerase